MNPSQAIEILNKEIPEEYRINTYINLVDEIKKGRVYLLKGLEFKINYIKNQAADIQYKAISTFKREVPEELKDEFEYKYVIDKLNESPLLAQKVLCDNNYHIKKFILALYQKRAEEEIYSRLELEGEEPNTYFSENQQFADLESFEGVGLNIKTGTQFYRDERKALCNGYGISRRTDTRKSFEEIHPIDLL